LFLSIYGGLANGMAERLFQNHCDRLSIEFETNNEKQGRWTDNGYKDFTEYRLKTKINPVPKNSNIPSHILVFTEQASAQTTFFVIFEKQFPNKRVTLVLCSEKSQEDFKHLLMVKLAKYTPRTDEIPFTTDGLRRTLQEHCNAGGFRFTLGIMHMALHAQEGQLCNFILVKYSA
jgi:hypothetical protein